MKSCSLWADFGDGRRYSRLRHSVSHGRRPVRTPVTWGCNKGVWRRCEIWPLVPFGHLNFFGDVFKSSRASLLQPTLLPPFTDTPRPCADTKLGARRDSCVERILFILFSFSSFPPIVACRRATTHRTPAMARSRSSLALGLGLLCWIALLFSPLAFVQTAKADETENYGTVIGIVSRTNLKRGSFAQF